MKIVYITARTPLGKGETFILEELLELKNQGVNLLIIPRNPTKKIFHKEAESLMNNSVCLPLINVTIFVKFLFSFITKAQIVKVIGNIFKYSRSVHILVKNLAVLAKGVYIVDIIKHNKVRHIHSHWGSTTSTMAYISSELSGIPWSFTLHRWDIKENNMLKEKVKSAKFVRCISEHGKNELFEIIGSGSKDKIQVIHMGVKTPSRVSESQKDKKNFTIVTPANLLEVKGHKYLIDACSILVKENIKNFQCIFYGEGSMKNKLEELVERESLNNYIKMPGMIPHEKLMQMYENNEVDIVILPSITTKNGEHEGIPVALVEAMAHSIPVISTNTGGIPELLSGGAGVMVEEKNSQQLTIAIKKLIKNRDFREKIARKGYDRVCTDFNIQKNTKKLIKLFKYYF